MNTRAMMNAALNVINFAPAPWTWDTRVMPTRMPMRFKTAHAATPLSSSCLLAGPRLCWPDWAESVDLFTDFDVLGFPDWDADLEAGSVPFEGEGLDLWLEDHSFQPHTYTDDWEDGSIWVSEALGLLVRVKGVDNYFIEPLDRLTQAIDHFGEDQYERQVDRVADAQDAAYDAWMDGGCK